MSSEIVQDSPDTRRALLLPVLHGTTRRDLRWALCANGSQPFSVGNFEQIIESLSRPLIIICHRSSVGLQQRLLEDAPVEQLLMVVEHEREGFVVVRRAQKGRSVSSEESSFCLGVP